MKSKFFLFAAVSASTRLERILAIAPCWIEFGAEQFELVHMERVVISAATSIFYSLLLVGPNIQFRWKLVLVVDR